SIFPPGYYAGISGKTHLLVWETDTLLSTTDVLLSPPYNNGLGQFSSVAVDTLTNSLYCAGTIAITQSGGPLILRRDTLTGYASNDFLISKISINGYLPDEPPFIEVGRDTFLCAGNSVNIGDPAGARFGVAPYQYSWSPAIGLADPNAPYTSATPPTSQTYVLTTTDAASQVSTDTIRITVATAPDPLTVTASGALTFCEYSTGVTLTASPAHQYSWSTGQTTRSIVVNRTGSYTVRDSLGVTCKSATSVPIVTNAFPRPEQPTITPSGVVTMCLGNPTPLTSSPGDQYLWYPVAATTQTFTPSVSASYCVTTRSNQGCLSLPSYFVVVNFVAPPATPAGITASGPLTFCEGGSVTLTAPVLAAGHIPLWSNGETTQSITVTSTGGYSVKDSIPSGCVSEWSLPVNVIVNPLPPAPAITTSGPATFCQGESLTLTAGNIDAGHVYSWSNGAASQSIIANTTGNYTVRDSIPNGCVSVPSAPINITVNPAPAPPQLTTSGATTFCQGESVTLIAGNITPGHIYSWSNGASSQSISVNTTGNYTVRDSIPNGCVSVPSAPINVIVKPVPAPPQITTSGSTIFCEGSSVTLSAGTADQYIWSTGATTQSITVNSSGSYSVKVGIGNCISPVSAPVVITVLPVPASPSISPTGEVSICSGNSVTLTSSPAHNYLWSNGANTQSITVSSANSYWVADSISGGCRSLPSASVTISVVALPPVPVITQNGSMLTSSVPTGNQWYFEGNLIPRATSSQYTYTSPGNYSVTVTNSSGCTSGSGNYNAGFANGFTTTLRNGETFLHFISPNPILGNSMVNFNLKSAARVGISIFESNGSKVSELLKTQLLAAGDHRIAIGNNFFKLRTGVYFITYFINDEKVIDKVVVGK
ncbi:hypothetical protein, partial [Ferruginibacter sp. HRS2-29]|uniref:hypothetical protein n=1 Tax=Ferruginibacter sp. HRS2-29 TaxID=2487334 RepID=UPI0020CD1AF0